MKYPKLERACKSEVGGCESDGYILRLDDGDNWHHLTWQEIVQLNKEMQRQRIAKRDPFFKFNVQLG